MSIGKVDYTGTDIPTPLLRPSSLEGSRSNFWRASPFSAPVYEIAHPAMSFRSVTCDPCLGLRPHSLLFCLSLLFICSTYIHKTVYFITIKTLNMTLINWPSKLFVLNLIMGMASKRVVQIQFKITKDTKIHKHLWIYFRGSSERKCIKVSLKI